MRTELASRACAGRVLFALLILLSLCATAQECMRTAETLKPTAVYDRPPSFSTGAGWKVGQKTDSLGVKSAVRVCESVQVGFFQNKKTWYHIRYGQDRQGWVFSQDLGIHAGRGTSGRVGGFSIVSAAVAADAVVATEANVPTSEKWGILGLVCISILLGMAAKVVFDELSIEKKVPLRRSLSLRKFLKPVIAAPLSFAAFLEIGDLTASGALGIAFLLCMAFQNGFFWQTLLLPATPATRVK